jgi:hypothetical protein
LAIFETESHVYARASLDSDPSICTFHLAGMTGVCHHAQLLLVEMVSHQLLPGLALSLHPLCLCLLMARITCVCHL